MDNKMLVHTKGVEKSKLYKLFVILSILICMFLFPCVNSMISKNANQIVIFVWSVLIVYFVMLIILIVRRTNHRVVYYPLSLFTLIVIIFNLGVIYIGEAILWYLLALSYPLIGLMVVLGIIGHRQDHNTLTKKTVGIILGSFLAIMLIILMSNLIISFIDNKIKEKMNIKTIVVEQLNDQINEIEEEFNNLLDSNWVCVYDLELNEDCSTIKNIELLITSENVPDNEMDFCNKLIDEYINIKGLLNKYNYSFQTIHFQFTNKNPFAKADSTFYQESGYIRDDETVYYIYLNPRPLQINK